MLNSAVQITNSSFIKSEIERFESVHPSIYSIYELLDEIRDQTQTQTQIRDHVMIIEGKSRCRIDNETRWRRSFD
jgi:Arf-GAP with GTPase, ANK repeat and PH domain-containing protein 1/3/4/5/6/9/11